VHGQSSKKGLSFEISLRSSAHPAKRGADGVGGHAELAFQYADSTLTDSTQVFYNVPYNVSENHSIRQQMEHGEGSPGKRGESLHLYL
jgi:hypothetical protein